MRQSDIVAILANAIHLQHGPRFPAKELAKLSFDTFELLGAINWLRVDPDSAQFDLVDGACTDNPPSGPVVPRIKRGAEV